MVGDARAHGASAQRLSCAHPHLTHAAPSNFEPKHPLSASLPPPPPSQPERQLHCCCFRIPSPLPAVAFGARVRSGPNTGSCYNFGSCQTTVGRATDGLFDQDISLDFATYNKGNQIYVEVSGASQRAQQAAALWCGALRISKCRHASCQHLLLHRAPTWSFHAASHAVPPPCCLHACMWLDGE